MFRALLRLVVVLVILVGIGAFFLGWWGSGRSVPFNRPSVTIENPGRKINTEKAEALGAEVGAKAAEAANRAGAVLSDGALTAKIRSKMALDDLVKARSIDVSTTNHVVTLKGTVGSVAEHERAVRLAKETAGVTEVVDRLAVSR